MSFHQGMDGAEPVRSDAVAGSREERRTVGSLLATGTLACPRCDAPVFPAAPMAPAAPIACPYCLHAAAVRDFLSLAPPTRPARVAVRVVRRSSLGRLRRPLRT